MSGFVEMAAHLTTIVASLAALSAPAAAVGLGLVPRAGPGRALALALRSRFARAPSPQSARAADVRELRETLASISARHYVVVQGPKGVGKTCVVSTALQHTCGVVVSEVAPGAKKDAIVTAALAAVAGITFAHLDPRPSALRVLKWYTLLLPPPIIVLRVSERSAGTGFAETAGAVRSLVDSGFRAVIDSSPNSLEPATLTTLRQDVLEVGPMPRELLFSLPEHAALFAALRSAGLEDVAWAVLGGVPALYEALHGRLRRAAPGRAAAVAADFARGLILDAIDRLRAANLHPSMEPVLALLRSADEAPAAMLKGVVLPSPNKVLREVRRGVDATVFVPADAAMAMVLRHGLDAPPEISALRAMCAPPPRPEVPATHAKPLPQNRA
jgi:hypothetical protein